MGEWKELVPWKGSGAVKRIVVFGPNRLGVAKSGDKPRLYLAGLPYEPLDCKKLSAS